MLFLRVSIAVSYVKKHSTQPRALTTSVREHGAAEVVHFQEFSTQLKTKQSYCSHRTFSPKPKERNTMLKPGGTPETLQQIQNGEIEQTMQREWSRCSFCFSATCKLGTTNQKP